MNSALLRIRSVSATLWCIGLFAPLAASAANYPDKPVKIVVPFAAAGAADILARAVANMLTVKLGQSFIVENRAGASGNIGAQRVAQAVLDKLTQGQQPTVFNTSTIWFELEGVIGTPSSMLASP